MSFGCFQFSQKANKCNSTWGAIVVKSNFFVHFLGELKIPKRHLEINWTLAKAAALLYNHIQGKIAWSLPPQNVSFCEFLYSFGIILCHGVFIILAFDNFAKTIMIKNTQYNQIKF